MEDLIGQPGLPGPAGPQGMPVSWGQIIIFFMFSGNPTMKPYKCSNLFLGHRQTMQTKCIMQCLIRIFTAFVQKFYHNFEKIRKKNHPTTQILEMGSSY